MDGRTDGLLAGARRGRTRDASIVLRRERRGGRGNSRESSAKRRRRRLGEGHRRWANERAWDSTSSYSVNEWEATRRARERGYNWWWESGIVAESGKGSCGRAGTKRRTWVPSALSSSSDYFVKVAALECRILYRLLYNCSFETNLIGRLYKNYTHLERYFCSIYIWFLNKIIFGLEKF